MKYRVPIAAGAAALIVVAGALPASALYAGTKTCTGSSYVYTTGTSTGLHAHQHKGPDIRERTYDGNMFLQQTTRYYSGGQGTYQGNVYGTLWYSNVSSASIGCDY